MNSSDLNLNYAVVFNAYSTLAHSVHQRIVRSVMFQLANLAWKSCRFVPKIVSSDRIARWMLATHHVWCEILLRNNGHITLSILFLAIFVRSFFVQNELLSVCKSHNALQGCLSVFTCLLSNKWYRVTGALTRDVCVCVCVSIRSDSTERNFTILELNKH